MVPQAVPSRLPAARKWFRLYVTGQKVAGSSPDVVIENFQFT
jgi:hypothetical protein